MRHLVCSTVLAALAALPVGAQAESPARPVTHQQALNQMAGVMYLRDIAEKCPLPRDVIDTYEVVAMRFVPELPVFSKEEIAATADSVEARVDRELAANHDAACQKAMQSMLELFAMFEDEQARLQQ